MCTAFVLLILQSEKDISRQIIIANILVFMALSVLFIWGNNPFLRFQEYEGYWWIMVINSITVSVFIVQMISMIMKGLNRRFKKAELANTRLMRTQNVSLRQIHLLNSLRQSGMVVMDSRLRFEERMQSALHSIQNELHCQALSVSLARHGSTKSLCIASLPDSLIDKRSEIPHINGPFLLQSFDEMSRSGFNNIFKELIKPGELYFASHFYTPDSMGVLELLLLENPVESDLNFLQMSIFQISAAITNDQLIQDIKQSHDILEGSYDEILQAWARILETPRH